MNEYDINEKTPAGTYIKVAVGEQFRIRITPRDGPGVRRGPAPSANSTASVAQPLFPNRFGFWGSRSPRYRTTNRPNRNSVCQSEQRA